MPMWQYNRKPSPPPQTVHKPVAVEVLSADLTDAVMAGDMAAARRVFDRAFWDKVDFKPDGYHLLQAVRRDNRDMAKLLTTHGATWTPDETKIARAIAGEKRWENMESVLRNAGLRTRFTAEELRDLNPVTATDWARRSVEDAERLDAPDATAARRDFERIIASGVTLLMRRNARAEAVRLLLARGKCLGDGSPESPLDLDREFNALATLSLHDSSLALALLDAAKEHGLQVKPVRLTSTALWLTPGLLGALDKRGLLNEAQAQERMHLVQNWAIIQSKIETPAGTVIELDDRFVDSRHRELRQAAAVLFRAGRPLTAGEAEHFMEIHESRARNTPHALTRMETALLEMGFFDSPAFTVDQLKRLAGTAPQGDDFREAKLADHFNRRASARFIAETGVERLLTPAKFHEIEAAHRLGAYKAGAQETVKILDYLAGQVKKDAVPENVVSALKTLRDGGADFSRVNPMRYLGKKSPGLCKTLLDLDIVAARSIDLDALARRSGGELRPLTPRTAEGYADQEFMCQIVLESMAPGKYIPLRGQQDISYQREFLREYTTNPQMKRRFMAGRIHAPKP